MSSVSMFKSIVQPYKKNLFFFFFEQKKKKLTIEVHVSSKDYNLHY